MDKNSSASLGVNDSRSSTSVQFLLIGILANTVTWVKCQLEFAGDGGSVPSSFLSGRTFRPSRKGVKYLFSGSRISSNARCNVLTAAARFIDRVVTYGCGSLQTLVC